MCAVVCVCATALAARAGPLPDAVRAEVVEKALPASDFRPAAQWEAETGGHLTGAAAADATASGGRAWELRAGRDQPDVAALFGPYREVPAGDYVAFFRIELAGAADDDVALRLDACVNEGRETLGSRDVLAGDLRPGKWVQAPLWFHTPGGKLECRAFWTGFAGARLDSVTVFALPAAPLAAAGRVAQPHYSGRPRDLAYAGAPAGEFLPRSAPPAEHLVVFDIRNQPGDWRQLLLSLQGLVNREQPRLYLIAGDQDPLWLQCLQERGGVREVETLTNSTALLDRWAGLVKGLVVNDPRLPATRNVAMMVAATHDALVASPRLGRELRRFPVREDLRGRFHTSAEAYRWAFDTLWAGQSRQAIACLWPDADLGLRDYLYQHRIFTFWLSGPIDGARPGADPQAELELMEELLSRMPPNIPVLGFPWAGKDVGIGEGQGVQLFAEYAKPLVGAVDLSNASVHSGVRLPPFQQKPAGPPPALDAGKVYVTWLISDGDNQPVLTRHNFPQLWSQPERGRLPIAWTMGPAAQWLVPTIADYYFRTASSNDAWVCAVSGAAYTYPNDFAARYAGAGRARAFDDFLRRTESATRTLDLHQLWVMGIDDDALLRRYAEQVPHATAIFPDYGRHVMGYDDAFYTTARGVPVFRAATAWEEGEPREQKIERAVRQLREWTPAQRPAFLHAFVWNWGGDLGQCVEVMRRLGPDYVAVRPEHLAALAREHLERVRLRVRSPARVTALRGERIEWEGSVQNVSTGSVDVAALVDGLPGVTVRPAAGKLAPGDAFPLRVSAQAADGTCVLRLSAGGAEVRSETRVRVLAPGELTAPVLPGRIALREFEALSLPHRVGRAAKEDGSLAEEVWRVEPGAAAADFLTFGPYVPLPAGRYLALFRLKRSGPAKGEVCKIDANASGGSRDLAARTLRAEELPEGRWKLAPLVFDHPGGLLETRVHWRGRAALSADTILLSRLP